MTSDTTTLNYWLNWRVLVCAIWILASMVIAIYIIWKYEDLDHSKSDGGETQHEIGYSLCNNETWRPCIKEIHPIWLLAFRIIAVCLLMVVLIVDLDVHGAGIFYYYTQWTFALVSVYFGFACVLSIYGCYQYHQSWKVVNNQHVRIDAEQGCYVALTNEESSTMYEARKSSYPQEENHLRERLSIVGHVFLVIFQINAGAVMLTDCIYWFVIFPFLTIKDYNLSVLTVVMHSLNAILLLGDTALNCLRFPWFRISYFLLWTSFFVMFQWIIHACVPIWWPYPFLDLSSPYAPLWYFLMGLMHIPCYSIFALIIGLKHYVLSRCFPQSYQCMR